MTKTLRRILLAVQFHTIVPVKVKMDDASSEEELAGSVPFFPVAGAFQGALLAASSLVFLGPLGPRVAGGLALAVLIISSGGFDLDGLADTADALAAKAGPSKNPEAARQKRLDIMRESTIGAAGAVAVCLTVLLKYLLISRILGAGSGPAVLPLLLLMPAFSKWATVPAMLHGRPAREDGLGRIFIRRMGPGRLTLATLILVALWLAAFYPAVCLGAVPAAVCAGFFAFLLVFFYILGASAARFFEKTWGGLTGDGLGALTELADILFLLAAALWLGR